MEKRLLVIPDVHGRTFWKTPVQKYLDIVDRIVFLGDYLDPYQDEGEVHTSEELYANLMEIIRTKQDYKEKVVLLKGNHDEHYSSTTFYDLACGTRCDLYNWTKYHDVFDEYKDSFQLAHLEEVCGIPYVFTHAGLTAFWISLVNSRLWWLDEEEISVDDQDFINRINLLDADAQGQEMLSVIGKYRYWLGEKTGSVLWADIREHSTSHAPSEYGLDRVIQVFGHTRLDGKRSDMIKYDHLRMIDSQKCFLIDGKHLKKITLMG